MVRLLSSIIPPSFWHHKVFFLQKRLSFQFADSLKKKKMWHTSTCQAVIYLIITIGIFFFHFAVTAWFDITAFNFIMLMLIKKTRMHITKDSGELRWGRLSWPGWSKWGKCNWNLYGINRAQVMLPERERERADGWGRAEPRQTNEERERQGTGLDP